MFRNVEINVRKSWFIPPQRGAAGRYDNTVIKKKNLPVTFIGHVLTPLFELFYADLTSIKTVILSMMVLNFRGKKILHHFTHSKCKQKSCFWTDVSSKPSNSQRDFLNHISSSLLVQQLLLFTAFPFSGWEPGTWHGFYLLLTFVYRYTKWRVLTSCCAASKGLFDRQGTTVETKIREKYL